MNILLGDLPTKLKVNDNIYDIRYDYQTALRIIEAFEDNLLTDNEKAYIMLKNIYYEDIKDEDIEEAYKKAVLFLDCGIEDEKKARKKIYSFGQDSMYIYSGITAQHSLEENGKPIHWWKFFSFFCDMSENCTFTNMVYLRNKKAKGKLTKEEKQEYESMRDILDFKEQYQEKKEISDTKKQFLKEMGMM